MTRRPRSNPFEKLRNEALEGIEETVAEPKEGTVAVLKLTELIGLNFFVNDTLFQVSVCTGLSMRSAIFTFSLYRYSKCRD
jgi:hypothetical protein